MSPEVYACTSCQEQFMGIAAFAAHIQRAHEPAADEGELESLRRRALNLPDEDEDEDEDEDADERLPTDLLDIINRIDRVSRRASAFIAERNQPGLEAAFAELEVLEPHIRINAGVTLRQAERACSLLRTVEWVLREDALLVP